MVSSLSLAHNENAALVCLGPMLPMPAGPGLGGRAMVHSPPLSTASRLLRSCFIYLLCTFHVMSAVDVGGGTAVKCSKVSWQEYLGSLNTYFGSFSALGNYISATSSYVMLLLLHVHRHLFM